MTLSLRSAGGTRKKLNRVLRVESLETRAMLSCTSGDVGAGPSICLSGSQDFESDDQPQEFSWLVEPTESEIDSLIVSLYRGPRLLSSTTSSAGTFHFDNQRVGDFSVEVVVTDLAGNSSRDSRAVTVYDADQLAPVIGVSGSEGEQTLDESQIFDWAVSDDSGLSSVVVTITKDGETIHTSTETIGSFSFDDLGVGTYQLDIFALDADSDWSGDNLQSTATRSVTVVPGAVMPTIDLSGSSGDQLDSESQVFAWNITDNDGDLVSSAISITQDGTIIFASSESTGQFSFDEFGLGLFTISVTAEDALGQQAASDQSVTIADDDTDGPEVLISGSSGTEQTNLNQSFHWDVSDLSDLSEVAVSVTHDGSPVFSTSDTNGSFSFDNLGVGYFVIEVMASDADANWSGDTSSTVTTQDVTVVIDPDSLLQVTSVDKNSSGFTIKLSHPIDAAAINLYAETSDVVVTGPDGVLGGSLIIGPNERQIDWIKTGGPLSAGDYTIELRSGTDAFANLDGTPLDGNADGIAGDDFVTTRTIAETAGVVLSLGDFARGPGQDVDILGGGIGLPVAIDQGEGITGVEFTVHYDPTQLEIDAVQPANTLPANWGALSNLNSPSFTPGELRVSVFGVNALTGGAANLVSLSASVPETAQFGATRVITIDEISVNFGQVAAAADRAVQQVSYLGDVDGDRLHTGFDASLIGRAVVKSDNGFAAFSNIDPLIIAGTGGATELTGLDASRVARKSVSLDQPEVPGIPVLASLSPDAVDELLALGLDETIDTSLD